MKFDFKPEGVKRRIDDLGRVVIPMEFRRIGGVEPGDVMNIFCDKQGNVLIMPEKAEAENSGV